MQHWVTRYFKSLDKEEALVSIHPETGQVLGFHHTLPEDRPGADLPEDDARAIAAAFAASLGRNPAAMDLNESRSEKKKARRDYTFVWQARPGDARNVADARFRLEVEVAGDQAASLRSYWHLPETFTRARSQQNFISIPVMTLRFGLLAAGFVAGIWLLLRKIRQGQVPWRTVIRVAIPIALLTAVGPLLSMKLLLQGYNTAIPLETYEATMYLVVAMSVIFGFVMAGAAAALILSYHPEAAAALRAASRRAAGRDALVALLAAAGLVLLSRQAQIVLLDRFHAAALFSVGSPDLIVSVLPALAAVAAAIRSILLYGAALAICALIVRTPAPALDGSGRRAARPVPPAAARHPHSGRIRAAIYLRVPHRGGGRGLLPLFRARQLSRLCAGPVAGRAARPRSAIFSEIHTRPTDSC